MNRNVPAIPTLFNGIRYRSRLEAQWAAFFTRLEWPFQYEPFDLKQYIPDFVLQFEAVKEDGWPRGGPVIVEVKPLSTYGALRDFNTSKIDRSGWEGDALLVGVSPFGNAGYHYPVLGLVRQEGYWDDANYHFCLDCKRPSFHHASLVWHCYVCGAYSGNDLLADGWSHDQHWTPKWNAAKNDVQWAAGSLA